MAALVNSFKIFRSKRHHFFTFFHFFKKNFLAAKFVVIGFKQGKSPAMGGKKEAMTVEFGTSSEGGVSAHFTYVKHPYIA